MYILMDKNNNNKIIYCIVSTFLIFFITNNPSGQKLNLKWWEHEEGKVCALGVYCGRIMIIIGFIQFITLLYNKYNTTIRNINICLLISGSLLAIMLNFPLFLKLIPALLLQLLIIN